MTKKLVVPRRRLHEIRANAPGAFAHLNLPNFCAFAGLASVANWASGALAPGHCAVCAKRDIHLCKPHMQEGFSPFNAPDSFVADEATWLSLQ